MRALVLVMLFLLPVWGQAEIFKWVDERGNVHFGDQAPEHNAVETVTPNTDKLGVQLTAPESAQQWKQTALEKPAASPAVPASQPAGRRDNTKDYSSEDWCDGVVGNCFTEDQDRICKLRYGSDCQTIYHWKVCLHQTCVDNRLADKCDSPLYFLDKRPVMLGRRDLGRPLPLQEMVSALDWQCLSSHGFFCNEVAFENQCQEQYRMSCDELKNWVAAAAERCENSRDGDCKNIDVLIRYRPASVEESKKSGTVNARGTVITQDLLMQSLGIHKSDPADAAKLQPVLESMTGLNVVPKRGSYDCDRSWP